MSDVKVHYLVPRLIRFAGQKDQEPLCRAYWVDRQTNGTTDPAKVTCGHCKRRKAFPVVGRTIHLGSIPVLREW